MAELQDAGIRYRWLSDVQMYADKAAYESIVPILLRHLDRPYSDSARATIAGLLTRKSRGVERAWSELVQHYRAVGTTALPYAQSDTAFLRLSLANAVAKAYTNPRFDELKALIADASLGEERYILVSALQRRKKRPEVRAFLETLLEDPNIAPEMEHWGITRSGDEPARTRLT